MEKVEKLKMFDDLENAKGIQVVVHLLATTTTAPVEAWTILPV